MSRLTDALQHIAYHPVVSFNPGQDKLGHLDLTAANPDVSETLFQDVVQFSDWIEQQRKRKNALYLIGGYNELRIMYGRSDLFGTGGTGQVAEPRRLHIGIDIWAPAGTKVFAPLHGQVHSFAFNNRFGDYGATIILQHNLSDFTFHTLYGHLSKADLENLSVADEVSAGTIIGHFGNVSENGGWPPHLHIQLIEDMEGMIGDYPGVCCYSERNKYIKNCPDPDLILRLTQFLE